MSNPRIGCSAWFQAHLFSLLGKTRYVIIGQHYSGSDCLFSGGGGGADVFPPSADRRLFEIWSRCSQSCSRGRDRKRDDNASFKNWWNIEIIPAKDAYIIIMGATLVKPSSNKKRTGLWRIYWKNSCLQQTLHTNEMLTLSAARSVSASQLHCVLSP